MAESIGSEADLCPSLNVSRCRFGEPGRKERTGSSNSARSGLPALLNSGDSHPRQRRSAHPETSRSSLAVIFVGSLTETPPSR